jgi:photosystem II stability/assembly factor-like uncharacterized protein
MMRSILILICLGVIFSSPIVANKKSTEKKNGKNETKSEKSNPFKTETFSGLKFRSIGPAIASGRIADFAIDPVNPKIYFVAVASGGVWKTNNAGNTYEPVFDSQGSYSIGCVELDPNNSNVVWVGTGENNNQRSVAYGDGIYKSTDGGKSWKNMGLKNSEHIGMIAIDPKNSDIVYVAAYGPVWSAGGDRGIYKTTDGGKTWNRILYVSENTGFNEIHLDPRNPNVIYAAAHQRRRHVFTYVNGGPESNLFKSTNGGTTWDTLSNGLPKDVDKGRIGLAISPVNPDYIYAIIEAGDKKGGVYRSTDRGASWEKRSDNTSAGNYYQEIFCDPKDVEKVFYMDLWVMVSVNGGKSFEKIGEKYKHVDNHALWVDPTDTKHLLVGCDGGIYETYDHGANWEYKSNLPVTQFYKVATDNAFPFYNVYGGTQDNFTIGGPSRTTSSNGITNSDWFFTLEGDGFEPQVDPLDPDIVYSQYQYGGLARYNKKTKETVDIRPTEEENEPMRWNWDSPLLISHHKNTRLYFGSNKLFRTDDMGNSWKAISGDLSRQLDRNKLPVMGKVWSMDAISKNSSTDFYGNLVSIAESKFDENHLVVGTDDGLIHITTDGGLNWTRIDNISGAPERTYVNQIIASAHDKNIFYAAFNHHRYGDFKPYLFRSNDGGRTWQPIQNNLPERGSVYCIAEDHMNANLLFAGTEFGVYFSIDAGKNWTQLKSGLPVVSIRDMEIQKRENDLVLATFGRGFYILDDYTPLRNLKSEDLERDAWIAGIKDSWLFQESRSWGAPLKGFQGEAFFSTPNPKVGAVFTYYLKDDLKTIKEKRKEIEKEKNKSGDPVYYPSADSIRLEDNYPDPYLLFTITDEIGSVIRKMKAPAKKGINRITWDFRYNSPGPITFHTPDQTNPYDVAEIGHPAMPGNYKVSLSKFEDGKITEIAPASPFKVHALYATAMNPEEQKTYDDFCKKISEARRLASSTDAYRAELVNKIKFIKQAIIEAPSALPDVTKQINEIEKRLVQVNIKLNGDASIAKREFETATSINSRISSIEGSLWYASSPPTQTFYKSFDIVKRQLPVVVEEVGKIDADIKLVEEILEQNKAPYTPGRIPDMR